MRKDRPSRTALKVAFNIVTFGSKPGMEAILPAGIVDATRKLLVASGAAGARTITGKMGTSYRIFVKRKIKNFFIQ
ncbi:MAG: hypothetical protein GY850_27225 [bacterium]|nr:hypothetical protein [bacterium]